MIDLNYYDLVDEHDRHLLININTSTIARDLGMNERELFNNVAKFHKELAEALNVSEQYVIHVIFDIFGKEVSDFIELNVYGDILYKERALSRTICNAKTNWVKKTNYYNIFISCKGAGNFASEVARYILETKYPKIFSYPEFFISVDRFVENDGIFKLNRNTKLIDIHSILLKNSDNTEYFNYTINDLIDVVTNPTGYERKKDKSLFNIYALVGGKEKVSLYLSLDDDVSLTIPIDALHNKDWSLVENAKVFNIPCYPGERRWYSGKQKDAPYFNHPLIKELEYLITNL